MVRQLDQEQTYNHYETIPTLQLSVSRVVSGIELEHTSLVASGETAKEVRDSMAWLIAQALILRDGGGKDE